jgi:hypothetical protein
MVTVVMVLQTGGDVLEGGGDRVETDWWWWCVWKGHGQCGWEDRCVCRLCRQDWGCVWGV